MKIMVFDKTGTLTEGRPAVVGVRSFQGAPPMEEMLHLVAAGESCSEHPLARALLAHARSTLHSTSSTLHWGAFGRLTCPAQCCQASLTNDGHHRGR